MKREFKLPDLGEGVQEGQVLRLLVAAGEHVDEDQLIMEVETDKAAVEIPSPYTGVITEWHVNEQQVVNVGDLMVTYADDPDAPAAKVAPRRAAASGDGRARPAATAVATAPASDGSAPAGPRRPASPAVRKLARQLGVDLQQVTGSGPGGRVVRADVEGFASGAATAPVSAPVSASVSTPVSAPVSASAPLAGRPDTDAHGPVVRETITQTRKAIAGIMARAWATIPHVTDSNDADVTDLDRLRHGYNESMPPERRLGMLAFVIRAVARGLQAHPIVNASLDESTGEIVYKRYFNIAIGVQTERGLVAPVLHGADTLTIPEINTRLGEMVERARRGTFSLEDAQGATYTISNAGAMGPTRYSTPIITPPQVAVLAVGRSRLQPWIVDGRPETRLVMPLSHSMDHRVIDGANEMAFMAQLIGDLENPGRLML
ncbi:MAG: 2-oxo acid dehydrogenase subunit E2 [Planctomycetes bacterium]|nr:2-oxo acid dehydrogenase subunit E2 [Planctomycetota bacterium]